MVPQFYVEEVNEWRAWNITEWKGSLLEAKKMELIEAGRMSWMHIVLIQIELS